MNYKPLTTEQYQAIKVGDVVERMLAFKIPMYLVVQEVTEDIIDCGWTFNRKTGVEVDDMIPVAVSYISRVLTEKEIVKNGGKLTAL